MCILTVNKHFSLELSLICKHSMITDIVTDIAWGGQFTDCI